MKTDEGSSVAGPYQLKVNKSKGEGKKKTFTLNLGAFSIVYIWFVCNMIRIIKIYQLNTSCIDGTT